jgi:hypothetical protein
MRRFLQAVLVLVFFMQAASASADMVVFLGTRIVERSTVRANVLPDQSGKIIVEFYCESLFRPTRPQSQPKQIEHAQFICNEKFTDKYKETVDVVLKALDKDKYILPQNIFKQAGLTGCQIIQ